MTTIEAKKRLSESPYRASGAVSRINKFMTAGGALKIVEDAISGYKDDEVLPDIFAKRVMQVSENRCRNFKT